VPQEQRKKTQKNTYFCLRVKLFVYICTTNQQNRNTMKTENKNQTAKELMICFGIAAVVSFFLVQFVLSSAPTFNW
jgi:uncharacterized protein YqhQ